MKSYKRSQRVADQIKRDASEVIGTMLQDKTNLLVTISEVNVSDDLRYAKIFYTVLGGDERLDQVKKIFQHSMGYIQAELAHRLRLRRMPEISLQYDTSLVEGMRLVNLIDDVVSKSDNENDHTD